MLGDIPTETLPTEYRTAIVLHMDRDYFYFAFSDDPNALIPTKEGFMPNAHIKQISVMNGQRRIGSVVKDWIDKIREAENEK